MDVEKKLRRIRLRLVLQLAANNLAVALLILLGVLTLIAGFLLVGHRTLWQPLPLAIAVMVAVFAAGLRTWRQLPRLGQTAALVDQYGATRDRFTSALAFAQASPENPVQQLALAECRDYISNFDYRSLAKFHWPRRANFLVVPLVAIALIALHQHLALVAPARRPASAEALQQAEQLENMAQQVESVEELKKLADDMRESAERLRAADANRKTALRELSALENSVETMKQQRGGATAEELAALAAGLNEVDATRDAAEAVSAGEMRKAADDLRKTAGDVDPKTAQQIAQAMEQALAQLREAQRAQVAQQMTAMANAAHSNQAMRDALQKLAQHLQQMSGSQGRAHAMNAQAFEQLLAALQNMKSGAGKSASSSSSDQSATLMLSFGKSDKRNEAAGMQIPTGQPGSEYDTGTTESPFGKQQQQLQPPEMTDHVSGILNEGESLQQMVPGGADDSKARQRYRDIYQALAPAAEEAVLREEIPIGSRFLIQRYFHSIRPEE